MYNAFFVRLGGSGEVPNDSGEITPAHKTLIMVVLFQGECGSASRNEKLRGTLHPCALFVPSSTLEQFLWLVTGTASVGNGLVDSAPTFCQAMILLVCIKKCMQSSSLYIWERCACFNSLF